LEDSLVTKRDLPSEERIEVERASYRQDTTVKEINGDGQKEPASKMYQDRHGLPVMYDIASHEQKKQLKTETNTISVLWHELITPLSVIKGYAATLLQLNDAITEEQKEQYLKGIDSASNRVIRLLENLRDITKLEETDALTLLRISMPDLLRQIASETQNQTNKHIIKLRPCARLPLIKADPEKIEIVMNNLLINAIKYSPRGGDIEIEIRAVRSEQELKTIFGETPAVTLPCVITSVADSGVGIPAAELSQIFEKFYRVKTNLTKTTPGAGLGLYICKIIVEAHGGHIWAGNGKNGGTVFHVALPVDQPLPPRAD
jgi:signal transduction histidine kinase